MSDRDPYVDQHPEADSDPDLLQMNASNDGFEKLKAALRNTTSDSEVIRAVRCVSTSSMLAHKIERQTLTFT